MKRVVTTIIGLASVAFATTASAYVVEITTSIPAVKAADDGDLKEALQSAIDDAVKHAIAFTPTLVTLQDARLVGDRIYIMLLIVDRDGEETMKRLATDDAASPSEASPTPAGSEATDL
jgi:hypothetical protein